MAEAAPRPEGLRNLGKALKALTYSEMMEAAEIFTKLLEANRGPIAKVDTVAETFDDFLDALDEEGEGQ